MSTSTMYLRLSIINRRAPFLCMHLHHEYKYKYQYLYSLGVQLAIQFIMKLQLPTTARALKFEILVHKYEYLDQYVRAVCKFECEYSNTCFVPYFSNVPTKSRSYHLLFTHHFRAQHSITTPIATPIA